MSHGLNLDWIDDRDDDQQKIYEEDFYKWTLWDNIVPKVLRGFLIGQTLDT